MSDEDIATGGVAEIVVGEDISMLSVDELEKRIVLLEQEIGRIRDDIATKRMSKEAAESIFRS